MLFSQITFLIYLVKSGLRGIFIYTNDNSFAGAKVDVQELSVENFNKFLSEKSSCVISKEPEKPLQSSYGFLEMLDSRCDVTINCKEIKCNPQSCEWCKKEKCFSGAAYLPLAKPLCPETKPTRNGGRRTYKDTTHSIVPYHVHFNFTSDYSWTPRMSQTYTHASTTPMYNEPEPSNQLDPERSEIIKKRRRSKRLN